MNLKKAIYLTLLCALTFGTFSCRSHKSTVIINAQPKFETETVWDLVSVRGKKLNYDQDQKTATIQFNPEAGTISGCTGCNHLVGNYKDLGDGKLLLSEVSCTKMACPEPFMKIERTYLPVLKKVDGYKLGEYTLELLQGETVVLTYEKATE